jgi:hypothetical protein
MLASTQRLARAPAVDALVAGVEPPQRRAYRRVIPRHRRWHCKPAQLRRERQHVLRRRRLIVGGQIQRLARATHRGNNCRRQILHMQPVEHQPRPQHMPRAAFRQLNQRIATGPIDPGQPEHGRRHALVTREPAPLPLGQQPPPRRVIHRIGHRRLVDPATFTVGVHRR